MIRSKFDFELVEAKGMEIIIIKDLNKGDCSVTNDIENVVKYIETLTGCDPTNCMIIYRDSEGTWDGWDHKTQNFVALSQETFEKAIEKYASQLDPSYTF